MRRQKDTATLAEYVRSQMLAQGLSLRDVELRSKHGGMQGITKSHINKIKNGFVTNPSPDKLKALARGINRPEEEIFAIVLGEDVTFTDGVATDEFQRKLVYVAAGAENWPDAHKKRLLQAVATFVAGIRAEIKP